MVVRRDFRRNVPPQKTSFISYWSITSIIIAVNVVLFFLFSITLRIFPQSFDFIAIQTTNIISGDNLWTIFTSVFMHAGFFHLFVNMFSLFFLGSLTEKIIGRKRFFWFYIIAGVFGSLFFVFLSFSGQFIPRGDNLFGSVDDYAVGASGAIFGLLGLLAILLPRKEIYLILGPLLVIILQFFIGYIFPGISGTIDIIASLLIFLMIFSMFSMRGSLRKIALPVRLPFWLAPIVAIVPLFVIAFFVKLPIGNSAHLGGLIAGLVYGAYLRSKYRQKVKLLNKVIR
ncbi:MAG: rhomboid family intramembrane serine protease [Candidatus Pacearchaeota archaeon]